VGRDRAFLFRSDSPPDSARPGTALREDEEPVQPVRGTGAGTRFLVVMCGESQTRTYVDARMYRRRIRCSLG